MKIKSEDDANRVAYLGFIQGVINRMASASVTCKGFSATVFAGMLAVAIASGVLSRSGILLVALLVVILFAAFDCYYFYQEKQYRLLYDRVLRGEHAIDFDMRPPKFDGVKPVDALKSFAVFLFYIPLIVVLLTVVILTAIGIV